MRGLVAVLVLLVVGLLALPAAFGQSATVYACPHHPEVHSDKPGKCRICGMDLEPVANKADVAPVSGGDGVLTLEALEKMALERNPRLGAASASVDMAAGSALQAGLYPNPSVGATGDHLSPAVGGGAVGGFVEQRFVTAGKLGLARKVAGQMTLEAKEQQAAERLRVLTEVRMLYWEALGAQALLEAREELAANARRTAGIARELANIGQADTPDILAVDNEAERMEIERENALHGLRRVLAQLAALVNAPELSGKVAGDLAALASVDVGAAARRIEQESPQVRAAQVEIERTVLSLRKARLERVPDVMFRGGVRNNREPIAGGHIGTEGIFDASVELPIFNRNQGAIAAAKADVEKARYGAERTRLELRARLAMVVQEYEDARTAVDRYRERILPQAQKALDLYSDSFRRMATAYPALLTAERNLAQHQEAYVAALVKGHLAAAEIEGLLTAGR